jgi:hypothetical protein
MQIGEEEKRVETDMIRWFLPFEGTTGPSSSPIHHFHFGKFLYGFQNMLCCRCQVSLPA